MKKLFMCSLMFLLCACAGESYKQCNRDYSNRNYASQNCPTKKEVCNRPVAEKAYVYTQPRPQPQYTRVARPCSCAAAPCRAPVPAPAPAVVKVETPTPAPVMAPTPVVVSNTECNGCKPIVRQTREPVEIVYKKTTYTTVFEPKTTSDVVYEKEPVVDQKVVGRLQTVSRPEVITVTAPKPVVRNVSYTIENTQPAAPRELLIEEIK